ncbi:MAG: aminotransferase class I/II-fold pyridoxal phosphate-dependent enzyme [Thermacetogeniaceae bacterium]
MTASLWKNSCIQSNISPKLLDLLEQAEMESKEEFNRVTEIVKFNQLRVLKAFQKAGITEYHLRDGTGYGYGDLGRDGLENVYALAFEGEAALVRAQIVSGTHAIALALTALLKKGNELISVTGRPYDTLAKIIGVSGEAERSLIKQGIKYKEVPLKEDGSPDYEKIRETISDKTRVIIIQRSRGYSWRNSINIEEIGRLISFIKSINSSIICLVDNCYGEFVEDKEPTGVGADLIVGSLIKNPGGGLAPSGGYLVGKETLVEEVADRLFAPGLGNRVGTNLGIGHLLYQGFFMAPSVVGEALRGAIVASRYFSLLGFETSPAPGTQRTDIVQAIKLNSQEAVLAFCKGIQAASPIDSAAIPEPSFLPGYDDPVIMAAGTFIQGASLELTADAPIRPPYIVYLQGGLSYSHTLYGILMAAQEMLNKGLISL